jgi:maltooligosyltrehalose synthase
MNSDKRMLRENFPADFERHNSLLRKIKREQKITEQLAVLSEEIVQLIASINDPKARFIIGEYRRLGGDDGINDGPVE